MNILVEDRGDYSACQRYRLTVPDDAGGRRLDQVLAELLSQHSRNRLQGWIREGRVQIDGVAETEPKRKVVGGEHLEIVAGADEQAAAGRPEDIPLSIVFEDETLLVIDKPAGLVVHPGSGNWSGTLLNALLHHAPELERVPRAGIVHRLDKETSGLLVVARTLEAQTELVRQMQARTVKRRYLAVVLGEVARDGTVDAPIGRHPVQRTKMAIVQGGREAVTHYRILEQYAGCTLLECRLETGRTHQIRVHMASIKHPLLGDPVYGRVTRHLPNFERQALHAVNLGLVHPSSGRDMRWEAPIPEDLDNLLEKLRGT